MSMPINTNNYIEGSSARKLNAEVPLSAPRNKPRFEGEEVILRSPFFTYTPKTDDNGLSGNTFGAKVLVGTATDEVSTATQVGNAIGSNDNSQGYKRNGDGPSGSDPPPPPPSDPTVSVTSNNEAAKPKAKEKKMSSASTLWTLGLTTGALVLSSIGISLSPINEDLKKFLHVCAYSLTAFTGILLAALGLTEISDRTSGKKNSNSNEEI